MAEELNDQERRETELWQVLDWSLWGNGLGDVLRESIADKTFAAIAVEEREQAEACIKAWHERRGPSMAVGEGTELAKRVAYLEARVGELNNTIGELRAESENRLQVGDRLGWRLVEAQQENQRLRPELDRLHSWAGLMELLDEHWPAEVFDGQSEDSDPGPRIVSLIRAVDAERASRQAWAEEAMRLDVENIELRDQLREEQIWREDIMRDMAGLNPDRPLAKTARRYRRERDEAREDIEQLRRKAEGCGCPSEADPDPLATVLPCGHRAPRSVPQCAVHPTAPDLTDDEPPEVWVEAPDDADYSLPVHPEGGTA